MTRLRRSLAAGVLVALLGACGAADPTPQSEPGPADEPSIAEPIERANEVADQVNQREADFDAILEEMGD